MSRVQNLLYSHSDLVEVALLIPALCFVGSRRFNQIFPGLSRSDLLALGAIGSAAYFSHRLLPKEMPKWKRVALSSSIIFITFPLYCGMRSAVKARELSRAAFFNTRFKSGCKVTLVGNAIATLPLFIPNTRTPKEARTRQEYRTIIRALPKRLHTIRQNNMAEENVKFQEDPIGELNKTIGRKLDIRIDGKKLSEYNSADEILKQLMECPGLSKERAQRVMCQLDPQIFFNTTKGLFAQFNRIDDWNLSVLPTTKEEGLMTISLTTNGDHFVIIGEDKAKLPDFENTGEPLAYFDTTVTLRIPKDETLPETGKWTWQIVS